MGVQKVMTEETKLLEDIINAVNKEFERACTKHPKFPKDIVHMVSVVAEEAGEAVRAANILSMEKGSIEEVKKELIETAAMCVRTLLEINKQEFFSHDSRGDIVITKRDLNAMEE